MAKRDLKTFVFVKSRPAYFWWTLANLLAAAFAIASWSVCLFLFNFPERPRNYDLLRKLKRLPPIVSYAPLEAPDGPGDEPAALLEKFYQLDDTQLAARNRFFKRNYITNFKEPQVVSYAEGSYKVTHVRALGAQDFFQPGYAIGAQAIILSEELREPNPYPVLLELLLPYRKNTGEPPFKVGDPLVLKKNQHRAVVLHATKIGSPNEPTVGLTLVPLTYQNYKGADGKALPLAAPDPLNVAARFPAMEHLRERAK